MRTQTLCALTISIFLFSTSVFASGPEKNWTEKIKISGDFRFRNEIITEEQSGDLDDLETNRQRLRLRLSLAAQINDDTQVITRLASGSTSASGAVSTNETLDGYNNKKDVILDLAYFDWKVNQRLTLWGGKTKIPYYLVGESDLYFDSDLTLEGLALKYKASKEQLSYMVNLGTSWLDERTSTSTTDSDVGLLGAQLAGQYNFEKVSVLLGAAQYAYANIKNRQAPTTSGNGNTVVGGAYQNDFQVLVYMLEVAGQCNDKPISFFAELIENSEAKSEEMGSIFGIKYGELKAVKDWTFSVDQRELEKDSTVGALSDSDISGGGTDIKGTRVSAQYLVAESVTLGVAYMTGELSVASSARDYERAQVDFKFNF